MPLYETVLIARNDVTQQQVETITDEIGVELEAAGGSVKKREYWGLRSLAGRFDSGRRRGYDDREEFRARDEFVRDDFRAGPEE